MRAFGVSCNVIRGVVLLAFIMAYSAQRTYAIPVMTPEAVATPTPTMTALPSVTPQPSPAPSAIPTPKDPGDVEQPPACGGDQSDELLACDAARGRCTTRIIKRNRLRGRRTQACELASCFRTHRFCVGEVGMQCGAPRTSAECYRALQSTICQQCVNECSRRSSFKGCAKQRLAELNLGILSEMCLVAAYRLSKKGC
jgi:hypothetical protein